MNGKIKKMLSAVSITLCATVGLSLPVDVVAATLPKSETQYSSFDNVVGENPEESKIVKELTGERTENSKEFLLEDGTKMIAQYNEPVHYKDSKGKWVEYNNTLSEDKTSSPDEAGDSSYTNKSSDISVNLSNKAKSKNMISLQSNGYKISWGYDNAGKSKADVKKNNEKTSGNDKFTTLKNIATETLYKDVFSDVDLQYFVTTTGIKENIILKSAKAQNEFTLNYKIPNLTAKQKGDKTITLSNKDGKEIYTISAPYMYDAKGSTSTQMKIEIVKQKGSNLQVKLTAYYAFIHTIGRAFPITIDPEITTKTGSQLYYGEASSSGRIINHGPYYLSKDNMMIGRAIKLYALGNGEEIISAKYKFEVSNNDALFNSKDDSPIIINAHKLNTYNSTNCTYDSKVLDYDSLTYEDNRYITFDLTKQYKEWYSNSDTSANGFVLEAFDSIGSKQINIYEGSSSSVTPALTLIYKDFTGTESNLSYHTINVGTNAQAAVSDYLGNLVINQTLYEGTGSRMPLSITATYNSINKDTAFGNGPASGYGWQFSFNQYVREVTDKNLTKAGYNYIYTDADGTDHYLKLAEGETAKWEDEDGLGITLTKDENNIFIDNGSTTQTYESTANGGKLLSEKDEHKNTITYTYTDGDLTKITDGSGRVTEVTYSTNSSGSKRVSKIKRPDGNSITFSYTSSEYDKINYMYLPGGYVTRFYYDSSNMLTSVEQGGFDNGNYQKNKSVSFNFTGNKVTKITEYGSDGSEGNCLLITYGNDNTTTYTDKQGRSVKYTFDNSGNKISTLNANGYLESKDSSGLSISTGAESFTKNYIIQSSEQTELGSGKYFYQSNGTKGSLTSSEGKTSIDKSKSDNSSAQNQYLGTSSLKIENPKSSSNSAFFTGISHKFSGSDFAGKEMTFSAYVKTKDVTEIYGTGAVGASLKIKCLDSSGKTLTEKNSIGITETQDWQRLSISADVPENTATLTVCCMIRYASGTAWFDCLQLEDGGCANDYNALLNGDFSSNDYWYNQENKPISAENGTVTLGGVSGFYNDNITATENATSSENKKEELPTSVKTEVKDVPNSYIYKYDDYGNVTNEFHGTVTKKIKKYYLNETATGNSSSDNTSATESIKDTNTNIDSEQTVLYNKYIKQNVKINRAGVAFCLSGKAKANSAPLTNSSRTFGVAFNIYYTNSQVPETHYQQFNPDTTSEQSICMIVSPNDSETKIDYVSFAFVYGNNVNSMSIYDATLNYTIIPQLDPLQPSTKNDSSTIDENYDGYIYCEAIQEDKNTNKTYAENSIKYDSTGNYVLSKTNRAGFMQSYKRDANGNITSFTDGEENVKTFGYDVNGKLLSTKSEDVSNEYAYNTYGNISSITHNGFAYEFNYDVFNQLVSTKIGNVKVINNTYDDFGNITETAYSNGDYIKYSYDLYGNITQIEGENGTLASIVYNKKGLVSKVVDYQNDTTDYYYYDLNGSIEKKYSQSKYGDLSYYVTTNSDGEIVEKTSVNGYQGTIVRGSSNGESYVENNGITVTKTTDDFDRVKKVKTARNSYSVNFTTDYEYSNVKNSKNATTNLVGTMTQKRNNIVLAKYSYTYDNNGNITTVSLDSKLVARYSYDELGRLVWAADSNTGLYTQYEYDNAGNITDIKEYSLSTSSWSPISLKKEKTYSYRKNGWKDQMNKFNGYNISYDKNGNPLVYRDGMSFSWENGRNLKTVRMQNDSFINMKYDINGMRTSKSSEDRDIRYFYDSKSVMTGLSYEGNAVYFYYDTDGTPTAMSFDDTMYYYIKNLNGDIVKIVNQDGNTVVTYTYDALGKITKQTDTTTYGIAKLNPFRYRGYVYDDETGLYYLQSRYYDPVTGRFINADVYCDTNTDIFGTNMFTYCNNDPINQVDPEGTDAAWVQFSDAVPVAWWTEGHTSLLLQDASNNWWYFYWGPKHAYLRPCGKDSFSLAELNSYLSGFDPRKHHNYYVYATNIMSEKEDINFSKGSDYYLKLFDYVATDMLGFKGKFNNSFKYAKDILEWLKIKSNATQLLQTIYENGKKYTMYHVCSKTKGNTPSGYYYHDIKIKSGKDDQAPGIKPLAYDLLSNNCVQVSMKVLLKGSFSKNYEMYRERIEWILKRPFGVIPNNALDIITASKFPPIYLSPPFVQA